MPKLLVNRKSPRKTPPCGRRIDYRVPHSPFQKLVEAERLRRGLSYADLAKTLSRPKSKVDPSSIWIWTHSENGFPHPKSFTQERMRALASTLEIPLPRMQEALDASRHLYTKRETPMPVAASDAFGQFIETLENDKRQVIKKEYVLNLARRFHAHTR